MKPFIRIGDSTDHGGIVTGGSSTDLADQKSIACVGDAVTCPIPGHGPTVITAGDSTVLINGRAAAREGDSCACGAKLIATQRGSGTA